MLRAKKGQDDKVLVATCTSANGKPPSVVSWETRLKGEAEYQEIRNPNGTVTVISRYRLVPSREAHQQTLACIVNYHMDRFRESLTLNVQCEQGAAQAGFGVGGAAVPSYRPTIASPPSSFAPISLPLLPLPPFCSCPPPSLPLPFSFQGCVVLPPLFPISFLCPSVLLLLPFPCCFCSEGPPPSLPVFQLFPCHCPFHPSPI